MAEMTQSRGPQVGAIVFGGGIKPTAAIEAAMNEGLVVQIVINPSTHRWSHAELYKPVPRGN